MKRSLPEGFEARATCARCRRPARVCYCQHLPSIATKTRVVILQHPRERDMPIGTAHMASLCLEGTELHVGVSFEESRAVAAALSDPERPAALLWPGEGATDVLADPPKGPITLVVVDGTWWQAKKLVRSNPALARLPRYAFRAPKPSDYRIRREPDDAFVSTIEALVLVLGVLEGDAARFESLLVPFRAMVDAQLSFANDETTADSRARSRYGKGKTRGPRLPRIPAALVDRPGDIVCVAAEANAWPYRTRAVESARRKRGADYAPDVTPPREEMVHWVARRLATGETLDVVVAPESPMSPGTPGHIGIDAETLAQGASREELFARWRAFARDTDVVCSWGPYACDVLRAAGGSLPAERLDLRTVARALAKGRVGATSAFLTSIGETIPEAIARGRAGQRAAMLVRVAEVLAERLRDARASALADEPG